jgi:hypothetical protein
MGVVRADAGLDVVQSPAEERHDLTTVTGDGPEN